MSHAVKPMLLSDIVVIAAVVLSVTELAREQPLDGSLSHVKSDDAGVAAASASAGVLPSPDVLNSLDMIHSWLQQSETHTKTKSADLPMCVGLVVTTSNLPLAALAPSQSRHLASASSGQTATVNAVSYTHLTLPTKRIV